jgi:hypothetical protein
MTRPREAVIFSLLGGLALGLIAIMMTKMASPTEGLFIFVVVGFWGLIAGLIIWLLYRAIRYAVRG